MTTLRPSPALPRPAGYAALIERFGIAVIPNWHRSLVGGRSGRRVVLERGSMVETYPPKYWPGDRLGDHLEFALKYDGMNLAILDRLFRHPVEDELLHYLRSKPTGRYARRVWYLYEFLMGRRLPLEDAGQGNYVDLLESEKYYTVSSAQKIKRQRVNDNMLGDQRFCPVVRRTDILRHFEEADLAHRSRELVSAYPPALLKRALAYLYTKETKSSFEIEQESPMRDRTERFVRLLASAEEQDYCEKGRLIEAQNRIVDSRFAASDYRDDQNYVGEIVARGSERIHYVAPKPEDLPELMQGLIDAHERMETGPISAVVHAAALAYGFVYLHPFEDGNGRIHRFLIHNVLARANFTPEGMMFPVSATMLRERSAYNESLESFSRELLPHVEYELDGEGRMGVKNDTAVWYRYIDMTTQAEALFGFVEQTIAVELTQELEFLASYDRIKDALQDIVDMPDRQLDLFIRLCLQNQSKLSIRKRQSHFAMLTDDEIRRMEEVVRGSMSSEQRSPG